jgi:hypothetical protein
MNVKRHVFNYLKRKSLNEGVTVEGTPDSKYYAFDWDDNLVFMPTQIIVMTKNDEEVGLSTEDFAEYRHQIGKEPFSYKGTTIVDYAPDPFRNFGVKGDKRFIIDSMSASPGPSWNDFVECVNGGSIFAIITARGHSPETLKEATLNYILSNHNGIDSKKVVESLKQYRNWAENPIDESYNINFIDKDIITEYLDLCRFEPVTFGEGSAANPEEGKINAMRKFISYCKELAQEIGKKSYFKNDIINDEIIPFIGFSDDDPRNIDKMKDFIEKEYEKKPVRMYLTKGGEKKEV